MQEVDCGTQLGIWLQDKPGGSTVVPLRDRVVGRLAASASPIRQPARS